MAFEMEEEANEVVQPSSKDSELDSALEPEGKPVETGKEVEPPAPETEDQKERSRLGRKVARIEGQLGEVLNRLDSFMLNTHKTPEDKLPEYITTPDDLETYLRVREQRREEEVKNYRINYLRQVNDMAQLNSEIHEEIFKEMVENFDRKLTGNPQVDARVNYAEAKASVLAKRVAGTKEKLPLKGGSSTPTGLSGSDGVHPKETSLPQLDEFAQDFIKKTGMSEDSVKNALTGDIPIHLSKVR